MNKTILLTITFTHNSVFNNREDDNESKRSDNKNNDYSKNNDLKGGRNDRLGKNKLWLEQETGQIYTRLKSTSTRLKITKNSGREKKNLKNGKTPTMGHYPRNGWVGDIDPRSNM